MRRNARFIAPLLLMLMLVACAGSQVTPDQEARIVLNQVQDNLTVLFDIGKTYVSANPQYQEAWKTKIVPTFDTANKSMAAALALAKEGKYTPADVQAKIMPVINSIVALLAQIGAIK